MCGKWGVLVSEGWILGGKRGGGRDGGGVTVSRPREIVPMNLQMVDVVRDMFVFCCVVLCCV